VLPRLVQSEPQQLKDSFLEQIEERAGMLQAGDSFLIGVLAHGAQNGAALLAQNFLTKFELYNALKPLKAGPRVSIVNMCHERERRVTEDDSFVSRLSFKREAARDSLDHLHISLENQTSGPERNHCESQ
jgi:hypothetical protein